MKLEGKTRVSLLRAIEAVGKTEVLAQSELFDPRVDLPAGELERIKRLMQYAPAPGEKEDYSIQTAWIGWVDPVYGQAIQEKAEIREAEWSAFLDRLSGKRQWASDLPPELMGEVDKAGAYLNCAALLEAFPEVRMKLQAPKFADDFQQVLNRAVSESANLTFTALLNRIQELKGLIQVWPEHRAQIIQALAGESGIQAGFVQRIQGEQSIVHATSAAAYLVLVFPELKPRLEEVVKRRMKEVQFKLSSMHQRLVKEGEGVYAYNLFIKNLTILGAESAVLDAQGNLQVRLRPLPLEGKTEPLPVRSNL